MNAGKTTTPTKLILSRLRNKINRANGALYEAQMMAALNPELDLDLKEHFDSARGKVVGLLNRFDIRAKELTGGEV